jgi:M6 family metalloprotease-like protein
MLHRRLFLLALLIGFSLVDGGPASPYPFRLKQEDGSETPDLYLHGSSPDHSFVTDADGYTVILDESTSNYVYATMNTTSGELVSSGINVGTPNAALEDIPKRLVPFSFHDRWERHLLEQINVRGDDPAMPPRRLLQLPPVSKNLVILVRFSNHKTRKLPSVSDFDTVFNRPNSSGPLAPTGSVRDVFLINSYGQFTLDSKVFGWVDLPQTEAYYAAGRSGFGTTQYFEALRFALDALQKSFNVNFADFDANGDGRVDMVTLIHSGYAAEMDGTDPNGAALKNRIWSHRWRLPSAQFWRGDGKVVHEYTTSPALFGLSGSSIGRIGVICHEIGHTLGLPDLYGTSAGNGIGSFDLMSNHWGFPPYHLSQLYPPIMSPWSKIFVGWLDPIVISKPGTYSITASYNSKQIYRININNAGTEYLLIENRQPIGFDSYLPQGGLAIWHINDNASNVEGFPGQAGAWPFNGKHYKVALLQADGKYDLERGTNLGDKGDCFPYNDVDSLAPSVNLLDGPFPNTDAYQNGFVRHTGIRIRDISPSGPAMSFSVDFLQKLSTTFLGGNGASGHMFDVKPKRDIVIRQLYVHMAQAGRAVVELWTKTGTHVSFERNPMAWKRRAVASVDGKGMGLRTLFDVGSIALKGNTLYSFYVLVLDGKFRYTNGASIGAIAADNDALTVYEGSGVVGPFGPSHKDRIWNGDVFYEIDPPAPRRLETAFAGASGHDGHMFDVLPHEDLVITGFDLHVFDVAAVEIKIFTKKGGYAGPEEQRCDDWELVADITVVGRGINGVTTATLPEDSRVALKKDQLQSFYLSLSNGAGFHYSTGNGSGAPVLSNEHIAVFEGVGVAYPCGSTFWDRVWNGAVHYTVQF